MFGRGDVVRNEISGKIYVIEEACMGFLIVVEDGRTRRAETIPTKDLKKVGQAFMFEPKMKVISPYTGNVYRIEEVNIDSFKATNREIKNIHVFNEVKTGYKHRQILYLNLRGAIKNE